MKNKIYIAIICALSIVFAVSTGFIIKHYYDSVKQAELYDNLIEVVETQPDETQEPINYADDKTFIPEYQELYLQNNDMVGWIRVEDTKINYPVMQSKNNPDFYLKHGFDMNCGIFKTYRVGNEYRASKKSVEENKKVIKAVLTYQDKKTMSVPDVMRILGLGKTATYRLINQCRFKTYLVMGKMRVDVDSFEDWYSGQFHYEKVNGERPGKKYGKTLSPLTVAKVLGIPRSTANDLMNDGIVEFIWVDGKRRIKKESFDKWYGSQTKYTKVKEIEEVENYVD